MSTGCPSRSALAESETCSRRRSAAFWRLALLRHVEDHGHQHDDGDDDEARNVPGKRRHGRGEKQNQDQRIAKPSDKVGQQALASARRRSGSVQPPRGWRRRRTRSGRPRWNAAVERGRGAERRPAPIFRARLAQARLWSNVRPQVAGRRRRACGKAAGSYLLQALLQAHRSELRAPPATKPKRRGDLFDNDQGLRERARLVSLLRSLIFKAQRDIDPPDRSPSVDRDLKVVIYLLFRFDDFDGRHVQARSR